MVNFGTPILIPDTDDGDRGILLLSQLPMKQSGDSYPRIGSVQDYHMSYVGLFKRDIRSLGTYVSQYHQRSLTLTIVWTSGLRPVSAILSFKPIIRFPTTDRDVFNPPFPTESPRATKEGCASSRKRQLHIDTYMIPPVWHCRQLTAKCVEAPLWH